jgi:ATP-dependent protease ClpP protease subunit
MPKNKNKADGRKNDRRMEARPYSLYEMAIPSKQISFYISEPVGAPAGYVDMIHRIKTASPQDVIYLYLNTPGGRLDTGVQIINAIRSSQATVVTVLESTAYSLGTFIFLAGHEYQVHEDCMMMFHTYSSGMFGKGNEQEAELLATKKWFNKMMKKMCFPFLSHEEIDRIIKGEDLWLDTDDIRKRLNKMFKDSAKAAADAKKGILKGEGDIVVEHPAPVKPRSKKPKVDPKPDLEPEIPVIE